MKPKHQKLTGSILVLAGLVGVGASAAGLASIGSSETIVSASALAESISARVIPATVGAVLTLAGLVFLLRGWWRGRANC